MEEKKELLPADCMTQKEQYVLGFALNTDHEIMLLEIKDSPEWMHGLFNGVGGKKNPVQSPVQAMVTEFKEKCGIETTKDDWNSFHIIEGFDYRIFCYSATMDITQVILTGDDAPGDVTVRQINDHMGWRYLDVASHRVVPDLRYLVPMAVEAERVRLKRF